MKPLRILSRCDVKGKNLIKGLQFEGVRVIGDPWKHASKYYSSCIDEILYILEDNNFIFNLGHGITPHTNPKNIEYLVHYVREFKK